MTTPQKSIVVTWWAFPITRLNLCVWCSGEIILEMSHSFHFAMLLS